MFQKPDAEQNWRQNRSTRHQALLLEETPENFWQNVSLLRSVPENVGSLEPWKGLSVHQQSCTKGCKQCYRHDNGANPEELHKPDIFTTPTDHLKPQNCGQ
jgi:hypothetical protein